MLVKTKGIIFRSFKYRESSLIVDIYTLELGLRSYIINGVRSKKSRVSSNLFQVMTQVDVLVYEKPNVSLNRIKEITPFNPYKQLNRVVPKILIGQCMIEVLRKTIRSNEPQDFMFFFILDWLNFLDRTDQKLANIMPLFLIELAGQLGYAFEHMDDSYSYFDLKEGIFLKEHPNHTYVLVPEEASVLKQLLQIPKEEVHTFHIPQRLKSDLIDNMLRFFKLHIEGFGDLRSLEVVRTVLS